MRKRSIVAMSAAAAATAATAVVWAPPVSAETIAREAKVPGCGSDSRWFMQRQDVYRGGFVGITATSAGSQTPNCTRNGLVLIRAKYKDQGNIRQTPNYIGSATDGGAYGGAGDVPMDAVILETCHGYLPSGGNWYHKRVEQSGAVVDGCTF